MVHEKNFRESITMLVVHDGETTQRPRSSSADSSDRDSDTDLNAAQHQDLDPALRGEKPRYDKESAALLSAVGSTTRTAPTSAPRSTAGKSISLNQAKAGRSCRNAGGGKNSALKGLATIEERRAEGVQDGIPHTTPPWLLLGDSWSWESREAPPVRAVCPAGGPALVLMHIT